MIQYDTVISPCVSLCRLDKNGVCMGCSRSLQEIREWYDLDDLARKKILENIEQRKKGK